MSNIWQIGMSDFMSVVWTSQEHFWCLIKGHIATYILFVFLHQHPQPVTCTWGEGWAWAQWSRSMEVVRGMVYAQPTSALGPGMWRERSFKLWRASRWWRRTPMGKREGGGQHWYWDCVVLICSGNQCYVNMCLQWTQTYPSGPERPG